MSGHNSEWTAYAADAGDPAAKARLAEIESKDKAQRAESKRVAKFSQQDAPTEDALALTFCEAYPQQRYVDAWHKWMVFDGTRWAADSTLHVFDRIRRHIRSAVDERDDSSARALTKAQAVAGIERLTKADRRYAATVDQWDVDPWRINTPAGTVDLRSGECAEHNPEDYFTKLTGGSPQGDCPLWTRFIEDVTGGDRDYAAFLQRVAGYAATGSTREHALFFLFGTGGNGKGTFLGTLEHVLGEYATTAPMETFTESRNDRHPTELAMLRGARLVIAQETEEGRAWAESKLKSLTGGDRIAARFMHADFFQFTPAFKLLIAGNHKPRLRNVDVAMRRRLHLLPFTRQFTNKPDVDLGDKLKAEADGIMQWIVEGAKRYQDIGLSPPSVVREATSDYFAAENLFDQWLSQCCERGPELSALPKALFGSWKAFAEAANERPGRQGEFNEKMEAAGFRRDRNATARFWCGIGLPQQYPEF